MATGTYAPNPVFTAWDENGDPMSGALLYTYAAGTSTLLATYSDVALTVPNGNPVVCDSAGRATLFLSATSYKFILKSAAGVTVWTRDNIGAVPSTNIDNDVIGAAGETLTATQVVYLGAGSWSKADADAASTSTVPVIAFVVADVASAASGTFRLSGRMDGFSGLTPGSDYYVSATAGEITATAPANARYVGRADSITSLIIAPNPAPAVTTTQLDAKIKAICNGRLSLTTGVPVTFATDVTAATSLKWVPYLGNEVALYSGSAWVTFALPELSIAVPATTNQMYDVFLDYHATTPFLSLLAWTNDTTRATAITTQDGVPVLTGATGRRHIGVMRTTGVSGQTEVSYAKCYVRNRYNRESRPLRVLEATNSWTYTTATWRQANAATTNQLDVIVDAEDAIEVHVQSGWEQTNASIAAAVAIGLDSTSAVAPGCLFNEQAESVGGYKQTAVASYRTVLPVGRHTLVWLEWSTAGTGTTTWYGDTDGIIAMQSGIHGSWRA